MDEKKRDLRVIENKEAVENNTTAEQKHGFSHPNQPNPIYKNLAKFHNEKIGEKFSIKDLLR